MCLRIRTPKRWIQNPGIPKIRGGSFHLLNVSKTFLHTHTHTHTHKHTYYYYLGEGAGEAEHLASGKALQHLDATENTEHSTELRLW